jgi:hypothetical protein
VNVVSSINRVIPRLSSKDQEQTLTGSHQLVSEPSTWKEVYRCCSNKTYQAIVEYVEL